MIPTDVFSPFWTDIINSFPDCERCCDKNYLIECKCGCGQIRSRMNEWGKVMEYMSGHILNGKHRSEEVKEKVRRARLGTIMPDETREKIRQAMLGPNNPFFKKHHTEETKEILRRQRLGKPGHKHTEESKKKMRQSKFGKQWSLNNPNWHGDNLTISGTRTRMRKIVKKPDISICPMCCSEKRLEIVNIIGGYSLDPDDYAYICRKCAITIDGRLEELMKPISDEARKKLRIARARRIYSLATRKKISESLKGKHYGPMPEAIKKKISKSLMGEKNPFWHGDKVGVSGLRKRMLKTIPKPSQCQRCGSKKELELTNISGEYRLDPNDWEYACHSCTVTRWMNAETREKLSQARLKLNLKIDMSKRKCSICGSKNTRPNSNGRPHWLHVNGKLACSSCYDNNRRTR
jgi:plasmid stability protein